MEFFHSLIFAIFIYIFRLITCCVSILGIKFHAAHNLNFLISDCHTLQLGKQKKVNSVIVENNPLKEQKNLRKAWFNEVYCENVLWYINVKTEDNKITYLEAFFCCNLFSLSRCNSCWRIQPPNCSSSEAKFGLHTPVEVDRLIAILAVGGVRLSLPRVSSSGATVAGGWDPDNL